MFSANSFSISGFRVRPLIHLESKLVQDNGYNSDIILLHVDLYYFFLELFVEDGDFSPMQGFGIFTNYQMAIATCVHA